MVSEDIYVVRTLLDGVLTLSQVTQHSQPIPEESCGFKVLLLGGLLYSVGVVVYATRRPRLWPHVFSYHEVFHVFVVAGSATHYAMTFTYVASFGLA